MSAKSVIELWLWGGPSQLETFDPKPNASPDYNNGLKAIDTVVPGMQVPLPVILPFLMDVFTVIRPLLTALLIPMTLNS